MEKRSTAFERDLRQRHWRQQAHWGLLGLMILVPVALLLYWLPLWTDRDTEDAPIQHTSGEVVGIIEPMGMNRYNPQRTTVSVRIDGRTAAVRIHEPVRVGQRVQASYSIGKSGRMYVKQVKPLREPAQ